MNANKKADLQRQLSSMPGAKPPADLADRIKRDIPRHFTMNAQSERDQLRRSISFNMRVAAGVLLVISAAYISMQLFSFNKPMPNNAPLSRVTMAEKVVAKADVASKVAQAQPAAVPARVASLDTEQPKPQPILMARAEELPAQENKKEKDAPAGMRADTLDSVASPAPGEVSGGVAGGRLAYDERRQVAGNAIAQPAPPPPPAAAAAPPAPAAESYAFSAPAVAEPQLKLRDASSGLLKTAIAADLDLANRNEVFGISVDHTAFDDVKQAIERGERPSDVNVEALVNYFAGPQKTRREVNLEAEGSPAPVGAEKRRAILRYTIDTASAALPQGASVPPVASNAKIEVAFEPSAVGNHRLIGGSEGTEQAEAALLKNTSVTALYEIELKEGLTSRQKVATVRLTYRSVADGRPHTITSTIYGRDFAKPWRAASRRHRLASLGAVWGETLKGSPSGTDVARRAEELALQEPKDKKARELASLATASSRLQTSAPTGSGR